MKVLWQRLVDLPRHLQPKERRLLLILLIVILLAGATRLKDFIYNRLIMMPAYGGTFTEGLVGQPQVLSPLSSSENNDRLITSLLFPGLTHTTADGRTTPMLAESWQISDDGRAYTFVLRENLKWHDGERITTSDIAETITRVLDPEVKSPYFKDWEGVDVEIVDDYNIKFHLTAASSPFLAATDLPIVPLHLSNQDIQNKLIGSGPYKYKETIVNNGQISEVKLKSNPDWYPGRPYIDEVDFHFYPDDNSLANAYKKGDIDSFLQTDSSAKLAGKLLTLPTQRLRMVFFNTESPNLKNVDLRKQLLRNDPVANATKLTLVTHQLLKDLPALKEQLTIWQKNNVPVDVIALDSLALLDRIDSHDYDLLFVDVDMRADLDRYPLWHSSQLNVAGGLNFSRLNDEPVDRKLEAARATTNFNDREKLTQEVEQRLTDLAAYKTLEQFKIYWRVADRIKGIPALDFVVRPEDRFGQIRDWYINTTRRTWNSIFGKKSS